MSSIEKLVIAVHDLVTLREEISRLTEHAARLAAIVGEHETRIARLEGKHEAHEAFTTKFGFLGDPES